MAEWLVQLEVEIPPPWINHAHRCIVIPQEISNWGVRAYCPGPSCQLDVQSQCMHGIYSRHDSPVDSPGRIEGEGC